MARFAVVGPFVLLPGSLDLRFDSGMVLSGEGVGAVSATFKALENELKKKTKTILGVEVTGAITFDLSFPEGGSAKLGLKVKLPAKLFSFAPGGSDPKAKGKGIAIDLQLKASNNFGIGFAGKTQIDSLWLGTLELKDASVLFDSGQKLLELGASAVLGPPQIKGAPEVRAEIAFGPGGFLFGVRKLALSASKINRPIGNGVFLQKISAEARRDGDTVSAVRVIGQVGLSAGPEVRGRTLVGLLGEVEVKLPFATETAPAKPWEINLLGAGSILDAPVSAVIFKYTHGKGAKLFANIDLTVGGFGQFAQIKDSWFASDPLDFNLEAEGDVLLSRPGFDRRSAGRAVRNGAGLLFRTAERTDRDRDEVGRRAADRVQRHLRSWAVPLRGWPHRPADR